MRQNESSLVVELGEVRELIESSLDDLYSPLVELARAHVRDVQPPLRAALVLASAVRDAPAPELRQRRLYLAAAIEMLAVAISLHNMLVAAATADHSPDKSITGSTILAGDYCFSRAADLAARTESPTVVDIFSRTLKAISERDLQSRLFIETRAVTEAHLLMDAGVEAAAVLAALPAGAIVFAHSAVRWVTEGHAQPDLLGDAAEELDATQRHRWGEAFSWLASTP